MQKQIRLLAGTYLLKKNVTLRLSGGQTNKSTKFLFTPLLLLRKIVPLSTADFLVTNWLLNRHVEWHQLRNYQLLARRAKRHVNARQLNRFIALRKTPSKRLISTRRVYSRLVRRNLRAAKRVLGLRRKQLAKRRGVNRLVGLNVRKIWKRIIKRRWKRVWRFYSARHLYARIKRMQPSRRIRYYFRRKLKNAARLRVSRTKRLHIKKKLNVKKVSSIFYELTRVETCLYLGLGEFKKQ